ncbi:hypothetical protein AMTR_s00040p00024960 [Amborella trichopoda]|uniref:Uncharacterized protein n=1 Tax=Amborella trichopoda TaxID=13333 RepID=W1PY36_AMBTC|nr:hypothetical protein AMTR_s00040p00024960 [Amborella trichopoda]
MAGGRYGVLWGKRKEEKVAHEQELIPPLQSNGVLWGKRKEEKVAHEQELIPPLQSKGEP